jgi:predicted negative regulator of RcsB-dependent stress response
MEERNIPYIVYESTLAASERHIKRLIIALVICIVLLFVSNAAWLYYESQYDYVSTEESTTYSQDGEGTNIIGSLNEVDN